MLSCFNSSYLEFTYLEFTRCYYSEYVLCFIWSILLTAFQSNVVVLSILSGSHFSGTHWIQYNDLGIVLKGSVNHFNFYMYGYKRPMYFSSFKYDVSKMHAKKWLEIKNTAIYTDCMPVFRNCLDTVNVQTFMIRMISMREASVIEILNIKTT